MHILLYISYLSLLCVLFYFFALVCDLLAYLLFNKETT
jgi:hypothetical protein